MNNFRALCATIRSEVICKERRISTQVEQRAVQRRKTVGNLLMFGGIGFLLAFFAFKQWSGQQSSAAISAFEEARATSAQLPQLPPIESASASRPEALPASWDMTSWDRAPDTTAWSPQRAADYRTALAVNDDTPQAILNIEHLNVRVPVFNGASDLNLNRGVARIIGTGRIGEEGNLGIAGHRDGFFRPLKDIKLGDRLTLETHAGTEIFVVSSIEIVDPTELSVLAPGDTAMVTLVTCYPFYHVGNAPQRFIVKAEALNNQVNS